MVNSPFPQKTPKEGVDQQGGWVGRTNDGGPWELSAWRAEHSGGWADDSCLPPVKDTVRKVQVYCANMTEGP